jgi:TetR/AcrR family transcriptional regulator, transcriptional repressor for nem operon
MNTTNKRERLIDSAATLFHANGMHVTSLADIAKDADIPIGNVYYYFKAKEELAMAAVEKRREQFKAGYALLDEAIDDPRQRLIEAIKYFDKVRDEYARYGCPIGKMIEDSDVTKDNIAKAAAQILTDFVEWSERQLTLLGHNDHARGYAITLMSGVQGAVTVAKAFNDPNIISAEVERLVTWLESLPNRKIQIGKVGLKPAVATSNAA